MFIQRGQGEYYSTQMTVSDPGRLCFIQNNRKPCLIQVEHSLTVLLLPTSPTVVLLPKVPPKSLCFIQSCNYLPRLSQNQLSQLRCQSTFTQKTCSDSCGSSFVSPPVHPCCLGHFVFFLFTLSLVWPFCGL